MSPRALWGLFAIHGLNGAMWVNHIPYVKGALRIDDATLGLVLFTLALGSVAGMVCFSRFAHAARWLIVVGPLGPPLALLAWDVPSLAVALFLLGALLGLVNVALNVTATELRDPAGKPVIGRCHAWWSIANIAGSGLSASALHLGLPPSATTAVLGVVLATTAARLSAGVTLTRPRPAAATPRRVSRGVWLLGALAAGAMLCEGAVADWAAVHLHDVRGAPVALAALAYGCYSAATATTRLAADRLTARFGPARLLTTGGLIGAAGTGIALTAPHPLLGLAGWAVTGVGLSVLVPLLYEAAGRDPGGRERAVARVSAMGCTGLLVGPALIGTAAGWTSLTGALVLVAVIAVVVGVAGSALVRSVAGTESAADHGGALASNSPT